MSARPEFEPLAGYFARLRHEPRPIAIIGAGGIVRDAHLPAYRLSGFPVLGIADIDVDRAKALATSYAVPLVANGVHELVANSPDGTIYDLALMPDQYLPTLEALPDGAAVLIQKPLGLNASQALDIEALCRRKRLIAAVNHQLRFAPYIETARRMIADNCIGELTGVDVTVRVATPWEQFPAVTGMDRLEILMHSVHYLDLVRSFVGDPDGVSAVTLPFPGRPYGSCRSTILLRYRHRLLRVVVHTDHEHRYGPRHEESSILWQGTSGAIRVQLGLLMDYPTGREDLLEVADSSAVGGWRSWPLAGSWFPDAFSRTMEVFQAHLAGAVGTMPTAVADVVHTMALVDAAYMSDEAEGVDPRYVLSQAQSRRLAHDF